MALQVRALLTDTVRGGGAEALDPHRDHMLRGLPQGPCAHAWLCELAFLLREQNHLANVKANVSLLPIEPAVCWLCKNSEVHRPGPSPSTMMPCKSCRRKRLPERLHVGLQAQQTSHSLHVLVDGGLTRYLLGTLHRKPAPLSVSQSLPFVPACGEEQSPL